MLQVPIADEAPTPSRRVDVIVVATPHQMSNQIMKMRNGLLKSDLLVASYVGRIMIADSDCDVELEDDSEVELGTSNW
jgi:hypothetical protein